MVIVKRIRDEQKGLQPPLYGRQTSPASLPLAVHACATHAIALEHSTGRTRRTSSFVVRAASALETTRKCTHVGVRVPDSALAHFTAASGGLAANAKLGGSPSLRATGRRGLSLLSSAKLYSAEPARPSTSYLGRAPDRKTNSVPARWNLPQSVPGAFLAPCSLITKARRHGFALSRWLVGTHVWPLHACAITCARHKTCTLRGPLRAVRTREMSRAPHVHVSCASARPAGTQWCPPLK